MNDLSNTNSEFELNENLKNKKLSETYKRTKDNNSCGNIKGFVSEWMILATLTRKSWFMVILM